ncbi:MAG TPA: hypothetical protein VK880_02455 [Anaerolineales bacterium]|nr:hypothetical protein [Anaerolineales bacterium]
MSNEGLRKQIHNNLSLKETDELLDMWQRNNRAEWSDDAFESIKDILKERGIEIPEQNEPVYKIEEETTGDETSDNDGLDEWEAKALDDENQPEFYDTLEVITLKDNINKVAKATIIVYALQNIPTLQWFNQLIASYFPDRQAFIPLIYLISFVFVASGTAISIAIVYFPLKALVHILRILMEMEFRSRKGTQPDPLVE